MKIESIRMARVAMPLVSPFRTAFGSNEIIESVLVQLSDGIQYGWGESASWGMPAYCPECAASQFLFSRDFFAPRLLHQNIESGKDLQYRLAGVKGNYFAKAAFDLAWWDLYAQEQGHPLWKILGGETPLVDAGADFGVMDSIPQLLESIRQANEQGYKRIKLKYMPGWDLAMIEQVRKEFPEIIIHIDCNSAYSLNDVAMFKKLDNYQLAIIEQPLAHDDLIDHAALQSLLQPPICLDESIVSVDKVHKAIQLDACRWVNIKLGRVGGITNALEINYICEENGIPCWVGGMLESAIGSTQNIAFATLPNMNYPSDIFPTSRFYQRDLSIHPIENSSPAQFRASEDSGIGVYPVEQRLEKVAIEQVFLS